MQASDVVSHRKEDQDVRGERRRSQRISLMIPLVVSSLSSRYKFAEYCKTLQINSYGCQVRLSRPLKAGTQIRLDIMEDNANRVATASVVHSELVFVEAEKDANFWNTGLALEKPGNIWGAPFPPEDWSTIDRSTDNPAADTHAQPEYPVLFRRPAAPTPDNCLSPPKSNGEQAGADRFQPDWRHQANEITARLAAVEARLEAVTAELEAQSRASLQSQAATHDLQRMRDALKEEQSLAEAQVARLQQEKQHVQEWLIKETRRFHDLIHDALVEASGQIKGQAKLAAEMAHEPMERRVLDAHAQIEELVVRETDELAQRFEGLLRRLTVAQAEAAHSTQSLLDAQRAEVLEQLQQQAKDVTLTSMAHLQATFNDTLRSLSRVLQDKLDLTSARLSGASGAGEQRRTAA